MIKCKKNLRSVVRIVQRISETLEPDRKKLLLVAVKKLEHGLIVGNSREVDAAVNKIARICLLDQ
jgi:hypothetical protein